METPNKVLWTLNRKTINPNKISKFISMSTPGGAAMVTSTRRRQCAGPVAAETWCQGVAKNKLCLLSSTAFYFSEANTETLRVLCFGGVAQARAALHKQQRPNETLQQYACMRELLP